MESLQSLFLSFISVVPALFQVGVCGYYLGKSRSTDAVLLTIGSGIHLLTSILYSVVIPLFLRTADYQATNVAGIYAVVNVFGFIGTVAFLIGLFLLIQKMLEQKSTPKPW